MQALVMIIAYAIVMLFMICVQVWDRVRSTSVNVPSEEDSSRKEDARYSWPSVVSSVDYTWPLESGDQDWEHHCDQAMAELNKLTTLRDAIRAEVADKEMALLARRGAILALKGQIEVISINKNSV